MRDEGLKARWLVPGVALVLAACGGDGAGHDTAVSADPAPVTTAPAPETPAAQPPAEDPIVIQTMACRGTPPSPGNPVAFHVTFEINYARKPWKWLRQVSEGSLPFATDPDGTQVQYSSLTGIAYVPEPNPPYDPRVGGIEGAYYRFDANGLSSVTTKRYYTDDFPIVCTRE